MGHVADAARNPGDIAYRLQRVEDAIRDLQTARTLESASIGAGGLRVKGGRILAEDSSSDRIFEVTTEPPDIFMRPELITAVSAQAFADRIHSNLVIGAGSGAPASPNWGDLSDGPGPTVPDVEVTEAGKMIVQISAHLQILTGGLSGSFMSFEVSGPTDVVPVLWRAAQLNVGGTAALGIVSGGSFTLNNLDPGIYQVQAKYQENGANVGSTQSRNLTVMAF